MEIKYNKFKFLYDAFQERTREESHSKTIWSPPPPSPNYL